jgi:predicted dehydrogenase
MGKLGSGPVRAVLIGAGNRGREVYGAWARRNQDKLRIVAVADPDPARRAAAASEHGIPDSLAFADWRGLVAAGQAGSLEAEAALVCTQDALHVGPALGALEAGWHVLLEKPMAPSPSDCTRLVEAAESAAGGEGRQLRVCHVVRYTSFFRAVKDAIESGAIGRPVHIAHSENVSFWHFGHSFVRGAWSRSADSTPIVLAKTCHDLDILYWLAGRPAARVSSFGGLSWYRHANAPEGAPLRCGEACPEYRRCLWNVDALYGSGERILAVGKRADNPLVRAAAGALIQGRRALRAVARGLPAAQGLGEWKSWPANVVSLDTSRAAKAEALAGGRYGRCIYACDNDQADHQVVSIEFEGGLTATMTMQGLSNLDGRWIRIDGSEGTLEGRFTYAGERLELWDHRRMRRRVLHRSGLTGDAHGGGDQGLIASFAASLRDGAAPEPLTSARASLESHLMGFAAERARLESRVVAMDELRGPGAGKKT